MKIRHLVPAALLALAACTLAIPVTIVRGLRVSAPKGETDISLPIDLTKENVIWSRRDKVKDFTVDQVQAVVTASATPGTHVALQLRFRPDGAPDDGSQDVPVGDVPSMAAEVGAEASLPGSPAAEALILDAIQGSGRFTAVVHTSADAPIDATLDLKVAGSLSYEALKK